MPFISVTDARTDADTSTRLSAPLLSQTGVMPQLPQFISIVTLEPRLSVTTMSFLPTELRRKQTPSPCSMLR